MAEPDPAKIDEYLAKAESALRDGENSHVTLMGHRKSIGLAWLELARFQYERVRDHTSAKKGPSDA